MIITLGEGVAEVRWVRWYSRGCEYEGEAL